MRPTLPLLLCAAVTISGCSRIADSRINPFNWFDRGTVSAPVDANGTLRPLIPPGSRVTVVDQRGLVEVVNTFEIARNADGGIATATGVAPIGAFNAQLVPVAQDGGTLTLAFRVEQGPSRGGTQAVTAARLFSAAELAGISRIVVQAQRNTASARR